MASDGECEQDTHQHHFEGRAGFVGCGVMAVGTNKRIRIDELNRNARFMKCKLILTDTTTTNERNRR